MIKFTSTALLFVTASAAIAEDTRQLDSHEHGVGQLDIAFADGQIAMELHAPGADIVGFEYAAKSSEDRAAVDAAVARLARPLDLFTLPVAAGCSVVQAAASLESDEHEEEGHDHADHADEDHKDDDHADHADEDHKDDDHAEHADDDHKDHDHADHADEDHKDDDHADHADEDHKDDDHAEHADDDHKDHDHAEHAEQEESAGHTEFHASYLVDCSDPAQANLITFAYFEAFPNALELEVQVITDRGATAFEVMRDAPTLDLGDLF